MDIDLKRRQELFLDGIETSLEMANICYIRLHKSLTEYSEHESKLRSLELHIQIILDAWSLVDIINRLRIFVSQVPGLKKNELVKSFQNETKQVEKLRDFAQHLDHEAVFMENSGNPLWGTLSWIYQSPEMIIQKQVNVLLMIPGLRNFGQIGHPFRRNPATSHQTPPHRQQDCNLVSRYAS